MPKKNYIQRCRKRLATVRRLCGERASLKGRLHKVDERIEDHEGELRKMLVEAKKDGALFTAWMRHHYYKFNLHHVCGEPREGREVTYAFCDHCDRAEQTYVDTCCPECGGVRRFEHILEEVK